MADTVWALDQTIKIIGNCSFNSISGPSCGHSTYFPKEIEHILNQTLQQGHCSSSEFFNISMNLKPVNEWWTFVTMSVLLRVFGYCSIVRPTDTALAEDGVENSVNVPTQSILGMETGEGQAVWPWWGVWSSDEPSHPNHIWGVGSSWFRLWFYFIYLLTVQFIKYWYMPCFPHYTVKIQQKEGVHFM